MIHATPTRSEISEGGSVKSEELKEFLSSNRITQAVLYRLREDAGGLAEAAASAAQAYAARGTPFDHKFDLSISDALYCTELVWLAYRRAGVDLVDGVPDGKTILLPSALRQSRHLEEIARF